MYLSPSGGDHGAVYYRDWRYPRCGHFFDRRIESVDKRYEGEKGILDNPEHPQFQEVANQLNHATIVKLADSIPA